jgi:hypothetical protein
MMAYETSIMEVRQVLLGIIRRCCQGISNCEPAWSHTMIASKDLKPPASHAEILDYVEKLFRLVLAAVCRFFCNHDVCVNVAMDEMTVNLPLF